jgi:hypothetical protein
MRTMILSSVSLVSRFMLTIHKDDGDTGCVTSILLATRWHVVRLLGKASSWNNIVSIETSENKTIKAVIKPVRSKY